MSPALASGFCTTEPQGSPEKQFFKNKLGRNKKEGKNKIKGKIGKVNMNMENK